MIDAGLAAQLDTILNLKDVNVIVSLAETSFGFNAHGGTFGLDACTDLGLHQKTCQEQALSQFAQDANKKSKGGTKGQEQPQS